MMMTINLSTNNGQGIIDLTKKINKIILDSNVKEGYCIISSCHTTTGILMNELDDKDVCSDIINKLEELIPINGNYKHYCNRKNAHAHVKASLIGHSKTILIKNNKLNLGRWQKIGLAEFDGPRKRRVSVKIIEG